MAMKETERSLRMYFAFAGGVAILLALRDWSSVRGLSGTLPLDWKIAVYVPIATRCIVGAGFLMAAAKLPGELLTGATWIKKLLVFSAAMMFVNGALVTAILDLDAAQAGIVGTIIGLLITIYLYRTVTRLSTDAIKRAGIPAPPPEAKVV
jgi:hypothetical protein